MGTYIFRGETYQFEDVCTYEDLAKKFQHFYKEDILLATADNRLQELSKTALSECTLDFITARSSIGMRAYRCGVTFMALKCLADIIGKEHRAIVDFSISSGYYVHFADDFHITAKQLDQVRLSMEALVKQDIPFLKTSIHVEDAIAHFKKEGALDKAHLLRYRRSSRMNLYHLADYEDYYYGYLVSRTGVLKYFSLHLYKDGFVIQMPVEADPTQVPPFKPAEKLFHVMKTTSQWSTDLHCSNVGELNDLICAGKINDLILIQEALMEKSLGDIADHILEKPSQKIVMIAGPSSSGKTTFSHRLSVQLRTHGVKPYPIAVDNYFVDRERTPLDENGNLDFECLGAVDVHQFNSDIKRLLSGEEVAMPTFNFKTGKREYRGNTLCLKKDELLVIEGIHCLNRAMSYEIPDSSKFKIYISALTTLNLDDHNRIPTTDGRLLRRMIRDARTRGNSAKDTIAMWNSVRRGEDKNIFPYQEQADAMFNSTLLYEIAVLKNQAEALLSGIQPNEPEYQEAKRLLKFLNYFLGIDSTNIPINSILREFIGGSCFEV